MVLFFFSSCHHGSNCTWAGLHEHLNINENQNELIQILNIKEHITFYQRYMCIEYRSIVKLILENTQRHQKKPPNEINRQRECDPLAEMALTQ